MRPYSVDTRTAGANAYFSQIHDDVAAMVHPWDSVVEALVAPFGTPVLSLAVVGVVDQAATEVGNQMVNCFASDGCDDTGPTWVNHEGSGIAVSPDDMIQWDSCNPPHGKPAGTYGYNEPAVYLAAVYQHKYTLQPGAGDGSMTVAVLDDSNPGVGIPDVTVIVDSEVRGTTDSTGLLQIPAVSPGGHIVEAQQYTGPALTPLTLTPTPDQILMMPTCPAFPNCQGNGCPSGWSMSTTSATVPGHLSDGTPDVSCQYACYPPQDPPPGCNLRTATADIGSGMKYANVPKP